MIIFYMILFCAIIGTYFLYRNRIKKYQKDESYTYNSYQECTSKPKKYDIWHQYTMNRPVCLLLQCVFAEDAIEFATSPQQIIDAEQELKKIELTQRCDILMEEATKYHDSKDWKSAIFLYKKILSQYPKYPYAEQFLMEIDD